MSDHLHIADFLAPVNLQQITNDEGYREGQLGKLVVAYEEDNFPELEEAQLVIVGCGEQRGAGVMGAASTAPELIRKQFYQLFYWHPDIHLADVGDIKPGSSVSDTYAALKTVVNALINDGKRVIILGGSHDLTLAQYQAYVQNQQLVEAASVDALIDLDMESAFPNDNFLMRMLTGEPNFLRHYNHIGFQSYYVHPRMLETMDKLRFDCFRVGHVKESIEEMEPVIRNSHLFSFDISAIANAYAPANTITPNGFTGEESCILMQYAGMSPGLNSVGIYGYNPKLDNHELTAKQIAHMLWYYVDGRTRAKREAALEERDSFNEFHTVFAEVETIFLQSKRTGRWWMQLPSTKFIACSYKDYLLASSNEIPERWLRAQEREG